MDNRQRRKLQQLLEDIELYLYMFEDEITLIVDKYKQDNVGSIYQGSTYPKFKKEVKKAVNNYFKQIDKTLQNISNSAYNLDTVWCSDGKSLKQRLAIHKAQMIANINKALIIKSATGVDNIPKVFKAHKNIMIRLFNTEMQAANTLRILAEAKADGYQYIIYYTQGDGKVCEICEALKGNIIPISEAQLGVNVPPMHPNCRCYIEPIKMTEIQ